MRLRPLAILLVAATLCGGARTEAAVPLSATYADPTDRYPHDIFGGVAGWATLAVVASPCATCAAETIRVHLPETRVFEDTLPRLWDVTGDGTPEVIVVESDQDKGARLVVLGTVLRKGRLSLEQIAATPFLGTRFRWLAPVAAADFDGDGRTEIAYVETPHRDKVLRLVRLHDGRLLPTASLPGVTAHRIGQNRIEARLRTCADVPELVLLSADYSRIVGVTYRYDAFRQRDLGPARNARLPRNIAPC